MSRRLDRLSDADAARLLRAMLLVVATFAALDVLTLAIYKLAFTSGLDPKRLLVAMAQFWGPFALEVPLIVGLLRRSPPSARTLPLHAAAMLALTWVHLKIFMAVGAAMFGLEPKSVLVLWITSTVLVLNTLFYGASFLVSLALARHRAAITRAETHQALVGALTRARLSMLDAQLNPHFLFNTLNSISTLALRRDAEGVSAACLKLRSLLQYAVRDDDAQVRPLADELRAVQTYLEIQKMRFGDRLRFDIDAEPGALPCPIPPMLVQPIVENAVIHGVARKVGAGSVRVAARRDTHFLTMTVDDDGAGFLPRRPGGTGVGLENARERLRHLYGIEDGVTLEPRAGGGTRATIRVPLQPLGEVHP